jgi:hypothetical protein
MRWFHIKSGRKTESPEVRKTGRKIDYFIFTYFPSFGLSDFPTSGLLLLLTMLSIDLNCDMGEGFANDAAIMPFISSVNVACGYHAGDDETMQRTV